MFLTLIKEYKKLCTKINFYSLRPKIGHKNYAKICFYYQGVNVIIAKCKLKGTYVHIFIAVGSIHIAFYYGGA
jgi:hypothetical protein